MKMINLKLNLLSLVTLMLFILLAIGSSDPENESQSSEASTSVESINVSKETWRYSEGEDEMTGDKRYFAVTTSTNKINFEFPYDGGSTFKLTVRNMDNKNEVLLSVDKGQFITNVMDNQHLRVKFDDGQPTEYSYNSPADGSSDLIFLSPSKKFIEKVKSSTKLMIEAPFFDQGRQVIYFDVEDLEWDK